MSSFPLRSAPRRQRGVTLIESLISLLVAALGIMGIIGMQMRTLVDTQTGVRRAQAIRLIEDLGERTKVHPNALMSISSYLSDFGELPDVSDCASGCDRAALAEFDVASWKQAVRQQLPLGDAAIFSAPGEAAGNQRLLGVMVAWRENERDDADDDYRDAIDAAADGGDVECPDGFTCHLQFIPVGARCAPYTSDLNRFFCPGA